MRFTETGNGPTWKGAIEWKAYKHVDSVDREELKREWQAVINHKFNQLQRALAHMKIATSDKLKKQEEDSKAEPEAIPEPHTESANE